MSETNKWISSLFYEPQISFHVMIDPSVCINPDNQSKLVEFLKDNKHEFDFYVPNSFHTLLYENGMNKMNYSNDIFDFYSIEPQKVSYLREIVDEIYKHTKTFETDPKEHRRKYANFYKNMSMIEPFLLKELIFEEWVFLHEHSFLISKSKKIFEKFIEFGGTAVEFSEKSFDKAVKKTLKLKKREVLTKKKKLRAICKWIALGAPKVFISIDPVIGFISEVFGDMFFLFDPKN